MGGEHTGMQAGLGVYQANECVQMGIEVRVQMSVCVCVYPPVCESVHAFVHIPV